MTLDAFPSRSLPPAPSPRPMPIRTELSTRPDGRVRLLCHLPPDLSTRYASLVGILAPAVERGLHPGVVANRLTTGPALAIEPWPLARARLRRALRAIGPATRAGTIVRSDVRDCYASIARGPVAMAVGALTDGATVRELLVTLDRIRGRGCAGLPIGPPGSAVLANVVLAQADRAIAATGVPHVRWVDDVLFFAASRGEAQRAFDAWRSALATAGLEPNLAKTAVGIEPGWLGRWVGSAVERPSDVR